MSIDNNVIGTPITNKDYPEKSERARVAYDKREADGKHLLVKQYVDNEKAKYGINGVFTLGMIYNATGDSIVLLTSNTWCGKIYGSFPTIIQNGQWGGFLHGQTDLVEPTSGSEAGVVYRARAESGQHVDIVFAWNNPWPSGDNQVDTMIAEKGLIEGTFWDDIYGATSSGAESNETYKGLVSSVKLGEGNCPYFEGMLTFASSTALI